MRVCIAQKTLGLLEDARGITYITAAMSHLRDAEKRLKLCITFLTVDPGPTAQRRPMDRNQQTVKPDIYRNGGTDAASGSFDGKRKNRRCA